MNLSLLSLITDMTLPNDTMLYLRKKGKIVNAESVDLSVLTLYKDYVVVPHIEETEICDAFLNSCPFISKKEKEDLRSGDSFEGNFRIYIDSCHSYGIGLNRAYCDFYKKYLTPLAVKWCNENKISYTDDLHLAFLS